MITPGIAAALTITLATGFAAEGTQPVGKRTARLQRNRSIPIFALLWVCGFMGCSKPDASPPAPPPSPTITQATFEPVYRASKAIQGATGPGVTYPKFGELLQGLSTEIGIAKDHQMNGLDRKLIALYEEALATYNFSAELWKVKLQAHEVYEGEIPVVKVIDGKLIRPERVTEADLRKYGLVPVNRALIGLKYQALPVAAIQTVWVRANNILGEATEMYYGRSKPELATGPAQ